MTFNFPIIGWFATSSLLKIALFFLFLSLSFYLISLVLLWFLQDILLWCFFVLVVIKINNPNSYLQEYRNTIHNCFKYDSRLWKIKLVTCLCITFYVYIKFCLGIRVGNEVRRVVGMTLMPSMPKSIPTHFCMILKKNKDLNRGFIGSSIEG